MGSVGLPNSVWRAVHVVGPGASVNVYVDETRRDIAVARVDDDIGIARRPALGDADDLAAGALDGTAFEDPVREDDLSGKGNSGGAHRKRIS